MSHNVRASQYVKVSKRKSSKMSMSHNVKRHSTWKFQNVHVT